MVEEGRQFNRPIVTKNREKNCCPVACVRFGCHRACRPIEMASGVCKGEEGQKLIRRCCCCWCTDAGET